MTNDDRFGGLCGDEWCGVYWVYREGNQPEELASTDALASLGISKMQANIRYSPSMNWVLSLG